MTRISDDKIILALLSEPSITRAARVAGVSRETIHQRLRNPEFVEKLDREIEARYHEARVQGSNATVRAVEVLQYILNNPNGSSNRELLKAVEIALKNHNRDFK